MPRIPHTAPHATREQRRASRARGTRLSPRRCGAVGRGRGARSGEAGAWRSAEQGLRCKDCCCCGRAPRAWQPARPSRAAARPGLPGSARAVAEAAQGSRRPQRPGLSSLGRRAPAERPPGGSAAATRPAPAHAPPRASRARETEPPQAAAGQSQACQLAWPNARRRPPWQRRRAARTRRPAPACQPASTAETARARLRQTGRPVSNRSNCCEPAQAATRTVIRAAGAQREPRQRVACARRGDRHGTQRLLWKASRQGFAQFRQRRASGCRTRLPRREHAATAAARRGRGGAQAAKHRSTHRGLMTLASKNSRCAEGEQRGSAGKQASRERHTQPAKPGERRTRTRMSHFCDPPVR